MLEYICPWTLSVTRSSADEYYSIYFRAKWRLLFTSLHDCDWILRFIVKVIRFLAIQDF